ncbi:hypothetical protein GCM10020331_048510 [Ectobacillus funiculus]
MPPVGVYAVRLKVKEHWYPAVCNIGYKPTFEQDEKILSIEVHVFEFQEDIYDECVEVEWHIRIRAEQKFNGIAELVAQIQRDKEKGPTIFFSSLRNRLAFFLVKDSILIYVLYWNHCLA